MPVTCGRPRTGSNAAPPLKSTRRKDTRSGGWPSASAAIHASRNSLFPLPVVPATIACGPSVARSSTSGPPATAPTAARSVSLEPGRRVGCASASYGTASGRAAVGATPSRSPAVSRRLANASASARLASDGTIARPPWPSLLRRTIARTGDVTTMTVSSPIGSPSTVSATAITTASCGDAPHASSMARVASSSRTTEGPRRCGSPVAQAHSGPGGTAIATTPGRHRCATCTSRARAADLASADGPTTPIPPSAGASTGAPSRRAAWSSSARSSASTGGPSTRTTLRVVPRPSTSCPGSPSRQPSGRRSSRISRAGATRRHAAVRSSSCRSAMDARSATSRSTRSAAPFRCIRRPCRRASRTEATATTGPRAAKSEGERGARDRPEHDRPAGRGDRGDPREAGHRRLGRVRRQGERPARRVGEVGHVGEIGDVGLVSFHPRIRSSAADADSTDRRARGDRRPPGDLCRTSGATPADDRRRARPRGTRVTRPGQATVNDCSASSTRLPRGTR